MRSRRGSTATPRSGTPPRSPARSQPPQASISYDHDTPTPGFIYCTPRGPHLFQPDDWSNRVLNAPAIVFDATADRAETVNNLLAALRESGEAVPLLDAPDDVVRAFRGLGFGYLVLDNLFEAADHVRLLDAAAFWADVTAAIEAATRNDPEYRTHLKAAAEKLLQAREQIHSQRMHWVDFVQLDPARPRRRVAGVAPRRAAGLRRGVGRDVRATRGRGPRAIRGTAGEVPARSALRRRSVLRLVPRPRGCAPAARVAVVEPARRASGREETVRRRAGGLRAQDERVPPATARLAAPPRVQARGPHQPGRRADPDGALHRGQLAGTGRPLGRGVLPRTAAGLRPAHVLQPRLPHAPGVTRRTPRRRSRSSTRASRRSTRIATCSLSTNSSRCSASSRT